MDSAQHCLDQAAECRRLMKSARSEAEAKALKEIAQSWARLAGQIDRYHALMREQVRKVAGSKAAGTGPFPSRCSRSGPF
jgi:hypothetical protein